MNQNLEELENFFEDADYWEPTFRLAKWLHEHGWDIEQYADPDEFQTIEVTKTVVTKGNNRRYFKAKLLPAASGMTQVLLSNWIEVTDTSICSNFEGQHKAIPQGFVKAMQEIFDGADALENVHLCGVCSKSFLNWWRRKFDRIAVYHTRPSNYYPYVIFYKGEYDDVPE